MNHSIKRRICALLLILALLVTMVPAALADDGSETSPSPAPTAPVSTYKVTKVALNSHTVPALQIGAAQDLSVEVTVEVTTGETVESKTFSAASHEDMPDGLTITWTVPDERKGEVSVEQNSANPFIATATAKALAEANADPKEVYVTVSAQIGAEIAPTDSCAITVVSADKPSISVAPATIGLAPNAAGQLTAAVTPPTAGQTVAWNSADTNVATVTPDPNDSTKATVTAGKNAGQTTITATANSLQATCTVQVLGIVLNGNDLPDPLRTGKNYTLGYTIYGDALQGKAITWSSDKEDVVTVEDGYLYAQSEGSATITAQISGTTYSDSLLVTVKKGTAEVITASTRAGTPLSFSGITSRIQSCCTDVLSSPLSYVSGLSVPTDQGTLYYRYASEADTGYGLGTGDRFYVSPSTGQMGLSDITFVPKEDFSGTATISYTGYASGTSFFQGTIQVSVAQQQDVTYSVTGQKAVQFNADDFAQVCRSRTGRDLRSVTFSLPDSSRGTLYYGYLSAQNPGNPVSITGAYKYSGTPNLGDVYFLPAAGTSGEVVFPYTAEDVNGDTYRGRVTIQVTAAAASGDISYTVAQGGAVAFNAADFNNLSRTLTGYTLDRVRFTLPAASQGTLYYNYTSSSSYTALVSESRDYYCNSYPYIGSITFVAAKDYAGTVSIPFTAWDTSGNRFYGEVGITVSAKNADSTIRYATFQGGTAVFDSNDFNTLSVNLTGSSLQYVRFTLPAASRGILYYRYNASGGYSSQVSASNNYYRSLTPRLDDITFVASTSAAGTVSIPFTGWNVNGKSFSGTVEIDVDGAPDPLVYRINSDSVLTFSDTDFDAYCRLATGESLNALRFTPPSSSQGTLYYSYNTATGRYDHAVAAGRNYYRASYPYVNQVSFVPNGSYSGTFTLAFTGWSAGGRQFTGTATITVSQSQVSGITYSTAYNPVSFQVSDFSNVCAQRGRGSLVSVKFSASYNTDAGRLYYNYAGIHATNSEIRSTASYFVSGTPALALVSFVPRVGYSGTVVISYTGTDSQGNTYPGQVTINVQPNSASSYFSDVTSAYSWAAASIDFLYANNVVTGTGGGRYSPAKSISRGDFVTMLDRALSFPRSSYRGFSDVPANSYYADAIQAAYGLGIVTGYADGTFRPNAPVTRAEAAAMLYRAMNAVGWNLGSGSTALLNGYSDGGSVPSYAREAMAAMVQNGIITGTSSAKLSPNQTMTRAQMATVLARVLTL